MNCLKHTVFMPACPQTVLKGWLTCLRPQRHQTMCDAREKTVTSLMILDSWAESFTFSCWFLCLPQCPEEALGVPGSGCSPAVIAAVLCRSAHTSCGNMKNAIPLYTSSGNGRCWIRYVVCLHPVGHISPHPTFLLLLAWILVCASVVIGEVLKTKDETDLENYVDSRTTKINKFQ